MSTFRIQYNGLTITPDEGTNYTISQLEGVFDTPIRTSSDDLTGGDGGNVWAQNLGMRTISFTGYIKADSDSEFFEAIAAFSTAFGMTNTALPFVIRLWNGSERTIYAKVLQMPQIIMRSGRRNIADYQLALICEDPYYQSNEELQYTASLVQNAGGTIPTMLPMSLSAGIGGEVTVPNTGTGSVYARFEVLGPALNPRVENQTTGAFFQIEKELISSETVTLERTTQGLTVTSDIGGDYFTYFTGTFFQLAPGDNVISFSAAGFDPNALLTITFTVKSLTPI